MKNLKFLWIDDMESWVRSTSLNLDIVAKKRGYNMIVIPAKNGEDLDIEQKASMYDFNCIIMDYHMEPFNGDHYIKLIREQEHLSHIPILFYSQNNSTDLSELVRDFKNVITVYRPNLEDEIIDIFFK